MLDNQSSKFKVQSLLLYLTKDMGMEGASHQEYQA